MVVVLVVAFVYVSGVFILRSVICRFSFFGTFSVCRTQATDSATRAIAVCRFPVSCLFLVDVV